jgi:hypothetical protein
MNVHVLPGREGGLVNGRATPVGITVVPLESERNRRRALALTLTLDCSDSMRDNFPTIRCASEYVIRHLPHGSMLGCVVFGTDIHVLEPVLVTDAVRDDIVASVVRLIFARGATNLGDALSAALACTRAARAALRAKDGFVLLLTDGQANAGRIVEEADILALLRPPRPDVSGAVALGADALGADALGAVALGADALAPNDTPDAFLDDGTCPTSVTTIGFVQHEGGVNTRLLGALASQSGGAYHVCLDLSEVAATFGDFLGSAASLAAHLTSCRVSVEGHGLPHEVTWDRQLGGRVLSEGVPTTAIANVTVSQSDAPTSVVLRVDLEYWTMLRDDCTRVALTTRVPVGVVDESAAGGEVADVTAHVLRHRVHTALLREGPAAARYLVGEVARHPHAMLEGTVTAAMYAALQCVEEHMTSDERFADVLASQVQYVADAERGAGQLMDGFVRPVAAIERAHESQDAWERVPSDDATNAPAPHLDDESVDAPAQRLDDEPDDTPSDVDDMCEPYDPFALDSQDPWLLQAEEVECALHADDGEWHPFVRRRTPNDMDDGTADDGGDDATDDGGDGTADDASNFPFSQAPHGLE